jgi:hypothetical protein
VKARGGQLLAKPGELPILGPEVMSPLADAVCLIDRDEAHVTRRQQVQKGFASFPDESLWRDIQKAIPPAPQARNDLRLFVRRQRAVVERRGNAVADQRVDLVFHQ